MAEGGDNALADARHLEQAQSAPAMIGMIRQQLDQGFVRLRFEPRLEAIFRRENDAASRCWRWPRSCYCLAPFWIPLILV